MTAGDKICKQVRYIKMTSPMPNMASLPHRWSVQRTCCKHGETLTTRYSNFSSYPSACQHVVVTTFLNVMQLVVLIALLLNVRSTAF